MRDQLVAVADAEQRHARVRGFAQPLGGALAPGVAVGDHRAGAGHDRAGEAFARGQCLAGFHVHDHGVVALESGGHADPMGEAAMAAHRSDRLAGFEDEERRVHGSRKR
jgi:hypothetical protein